MSEKSCNNCLKADTCKYVELQTIFAAMISKNIYEPHLVLDRPQVTEDYLNRLFEATATICKFCTKENDDG